MAQRSQTLALVLIVALLAGCSRGAKVCEVCRRDECKAMAFRVTLESGKTVETCCPRCGMNYVETLKKPARRYEATDFTTGHWVDATTATFVSGSDMKGCAMPAAQRDAQGCCMYVAFDRCLPSLVAFTDRPAAVEFQKQHGGDVLAFAQLTSR